MADSKLEVLISADAGGALRAIGSVTSALGGVGGALGNIAQFVSGFLIGKLIVGAFNMAIGAVEAFAKKMLDATSTMQMLGLQIQTLQARELSGLIKAGIETSTVMEKVTKTGTEYTINLETLQKTLGSANFKIAMQTGLLGDLSRAQDGLIKVTKDSNQTWVTANQLFDSVGPSSEKVKNALITIGVLSPYNIQAANSVFKLALAFQFSTDQAMRMTKGMLNLAAGVGASTEQLERMTFNFAQIKMQGKIMARDFWELGKAGFDLYSVLKTLEEQTGYNIKTHLDFNRLLSQGKVTWEDFVTAFETTTEQQFGKASERMAFTVQGIINTFGDLFTLLSQVFVPAANEVGKFVQIWVSKLLGMVEGGTLDEIGKKWAAWLAEKLDKLNTFVDDATLAVDRFAYHKSWEQAGHAFDNLLTDEQSAKLAGLGRILDGISATISTIAGNVGGVVDSLTGIGEAILQPQTFAPLQGPQIPGIQNLEQGAISMAGTDFTKMFPQDSAFAQPFSDGLNTVGEILFKVIKFIEEKGPVIIDTLTPMAIAIGATFAGIAAGVSGAWAALQPAMDMLKEALANLFTEENFKTFAALWTMFVAVLGFALNILVAIVMGIVGLVIGFLTLLANQMTNIITFVGTIIAGIKTIFGGDLIGGLQIILQGLVDFIVSVVADGLLGIAVAAIEFMTGLFGYLAGILEKIGAKDYIDKWVKAGRDLVWGIWQGVKSLWDTFKEWLIGKARDIISSVLDVFEVGSPSRVFEDIGRNLVLGLQEGVNGASPELDKVANKFQRVMNFSAPNVANAISTSIPMDMMAGAMTNSADKNMSRQLLEQQKQNDALAARLDSILLALQGMGTGKDNARAMAEALQLAEIR